MKTASERGEPATAAMAEVEMQIRGLMIDPLTNMPVVVLKDVASDVVLPIWVGSSRRTRLRWSWRRRRCRGR